MLKKRFNLNFTIFQNILHHKLQKKQKSKNIKNLLFKNNILWKVLKVSHLNYVFFLIAQYLNYYTPPATPSESTVASQVNSIYIKDTYQAPLTIPFDQTKEYFNASDYIWLNFNNNSYLGFLTLPNQVGAKCRSGPPLFYLNNKQTECFVSSDDISNECSLTTASSLSLSYFYSNFKFVQNPLTVTTAQIPLNIISCQDESGNKISVTVCATYLRPSKQATNSACSNLVKSVKYILSYSNPAGIVEAGLDVTFFSYDLTSTSRARQSFQVLFIPSTVPLVRTWTNLPFLFFKHV